MGGPTAGDGNPTNTPSIKGGRRLITMVHCNRIHFREAGGDLTRYGGTHQELSVTRPPPMMHMHIQSARTHAQGERKGRKSVLQREDNSVTPSSQYVNDPD